MEDNMWILQENQLIVFWFEYNEEGDKLLYTPQSIFKVLRVAYSWQEGSTNGEKYMVTGTVYKSFSGVWVLPLPPFTLYFSFVEKNLTL